MTYIKNEPTATHEALNLQAAGVKVTAEQMNEIAETVALYLQIEYEKNKREPDVVEILRWVCNVSVSQALNKYGFHSYFLTLRKGYVKYVHDSRASYWRRKIKRKIKCYDNNGHNILSKKGGADV